MSHTRAKEIIYSCLILQCCINWRGRDDHEGAVSDRDVCDSTITAFYGTEISFG